MSIEAPNCSSSSTPGQWLLALAGWITCVIIFFWPVVFQGKVLAPLDILDSLLKPWATTETIDVHNAFTYDAISQYLPYDWSVYQSLHQDGYIGWNPYAHNGTAILENTMLCPGDWHHQLYRFLPFWDAWNLGIILQFFIAGAGMLFLLRFAGIPAAFSLLGVLGFGLYSQHILWIYHRWVLGSFCWGPWIVWALLRASRRNRKFDFLSALFIALGFRGGHLQACVFIVILALVLFACDAHTLRKEPRDLLRRFTLYATSGLFAALLSAPVFINTIPPYLSGGKGMPISGLKHCILSTAILMTTLFPTAMGTPQGLDPGKALGTSLFDISFMGATLFILAMLGLVQKHAPKQAKALFLVGLILPFTPLDTWLYARVTVIYALGGAWLGSWFITDAAQRPRSTKRWRLASILFGGVVLVWMTATVAIVKLRPIFEPRLQAYIASALPLNKANRAEWMRERSTRFLDQIQIHDTRNLMLLGLFGLGLVAASKIHTGNRHKFLYANGLAISAFLELLVFSRMWITFSGRPSNPDDLYNTPTWVEDFKKAAGNGSVSCYSQDRFDTMQLNTPSSHGIRFQFGYETVRPMQCAPLDKDSLNPEDYALAGVSVFYVYPDVVPTNLVEAGWTLAHSSPAIKLYRNPAFQSRIMAAGKNGEITPVFLSFETANSRKFTVPAGTSAIVIGETYHPRWHAKANEIILKVERTARDGMRILLPAPVERPTEITLRFKPQYSL